MEENGEEFLEAIEDDAELEAVYSALMDLIYEDEEEPVSYTHLDVYKRQGIGPYNSLGRYSTDSHRAFTFCVCLLQPFRGAFCYRPSCRRTIMTARRAAPER